MGDNLRVPSVSAQVRGGELAVSDVIITNTVNGLASIQIGGHSLADAKATSNSAELPAEKLAARAGALQDYVMHTSRIAPDMNVIIDDGNNNTIKFAGFLSSPAFSTSSNNASMVFAGVHSAAALKFFSGANYSRVNRASAYDKVSAAAMYPNGAELIALSTDNIPTVLSKIIESYEKTLNNLASGYVAGDATTLALVEAVRARNAVMLPLVQRFLTGSARTCRMTGVTIAGDDLFAQGIRDHLSRLLTQESDFLSMVMNSLLEDFGLQFVCLLDGSTPGARLELISYANAAPIELAVRAEDFSFTAGGIFDLPIKGVVVQGYSDPGPLVNSEAESRQTSGISLAVFPPNARLGPGGRIADLAAPSWMNSKGLAPVRVSNQAAGIVNFKTNWPTAAQTLQKMEGATVAVLNWWARTKFAYHSLGASRATLTCPLDGRIQTGRVYAIRVQGENASAAQLFRGYASSVTHRLATHGALVASTTVEFTHVQAKGFVQLGDSPN